MESSNQLPEKEMSERLQILQQLVQSPGWAYFTYTMQQSMQIMKDAGRKAEQPHQMGFNFGGAMAIEQALTWPAREIGVLRTSLQEFERSKG